MIFVIMNFKMSVLIYIYHFIQTFLKTPQFSGVTLPFGAPLLSWPRYGPFS